MGACVSVAKKTKCKANKQVPAPEPPKEEVNSKGAPAPEHQIVEEKKVVTEEVSKDNDNVEEKIKNDDSQPLAPLIIEENYKKTKEAEPKVEEPKEEEEPKQVEPTIEEPKIEDPKQTEPKIEELKQEEEPKMEEKTTDVKESS